MRSPQKPLLGFSIILFLWLYYSNQLLSQIENAGGPENYLEYTNLTGEGLCGSVFIMKYDNQLVACMSRHQFGDDRTPSIAADLLNARSIGLNREKAFRQNDVQILPLTDPNTDIPYLDFDPDYELSASEEIWIARGEDPLDGNGGTTGTLELFNLSAGTYSPQEGPKELRMGLLGPVYLQGASGSPVFQVSSGRPIGVLLATVQDSGRTYLVFETLALPRINDLDDIFTKAPVDQLKTYEAKVNKLNGASGEISGLVDEALLALDLDQTLPLIKSRGSFLRNLAEKGEPRADPSVLEFYSLFYKKVYDAQKPHPVPPVWQQAMTELDRYHIHLLRE